MGGKALKETYTRRYEREEFDALVEELLPRIKEAFDTEVALVTAYKNKDTFGDMDVLMLSKDGLPNVRETLQKEFEPNQIHKNGDCTSFDCKELQIDLIVTPPANWETSQIYYSYNDLGNLMGRIFHKFGLKWGHDGLRYPYRVGGKVLGTIYVSKNAEEAFNFIGLDWKTYQKGFDTIPDIFEYVTTSPFFDPVSYNMENLNAINRQRNKKRVNYMLFLDYVKDKKPKQNYDWVKGEDKSKYFDVIDRAFPEANFLDQMEEMREKERVREEIASKFNGRLLMEKYPNLTGKKLGRFIDEFKFKMSEDTNGSFSEFILDNSQEWIDSYIEVFYKEFDE